MAKKKIIEKKLPEGSNIFEEIYDFMKQKAWVFISADLFWELRREFPCKFAQNSDRCRFSVEKNGKSWILTVYKDCSWNKVESLSQIEWEDAEHYSTDNPESIAFLS